MKKPKAKFEYDDDVVTKPNTDVAVYNLNNIAAHFSEHCVVEKDQSKTSKDGIKFNRIIKVRDGKNVLTMKLHETNHGRQAEVLADLPNRKRKNRG